MYSEKNYKGKTYADIASKIFSKYKNREDSISKKSMNVEMQKLATKNDTARAASSPQQPMMFEGGGPINPPDLSGFDPSNLYEFGNYNPDELGTRMNINSLPNLGSPLSTPAANTPQTLQTFNLPGSRTQSNLPTMEEADDILAYADAPYSELKTISGPTQMKAPDLNIPTSIAKTALATANVTKKKESDKKDGLTTGDMMQMAAAAMQAAYFQQQANQPIPEPRFNKGYDLAKQQLSQMKFNTQAQQNRRIRNRNAYMRGIEQTSPNAAIRNANMQGIFAQDDLNTQLISGQTQQLKNKVREQIGQLEINKGIDRQQALQYWDRAEANRDNLRHTGMNMAFENLNELGNLKNYYESINRDMKTMNDLPIDFTYGKNLHDASLNFKNR